MNQVLMKLSELPCQFLCLYRLIGSNEINIHFNELLDDNIIIRSPSIYLQSQFMSFFNPLRMLEKVSYNYNQYLDNQVSSLQLVYNCH